jgi:hypothetical protein
LVEAAPQVKVNIPREYSANQKVVVVGEKDQVDRAKAASEKVWTGPPPMEEAGCAKLRRRCNRVPAFALLDPGGILATAM